ncbi:MAG: UvrD-helicase domain-containing protein [Pirellulales bacterium]|nr:UvrD-helicase domain-containing protein [Pirellulales bacterium]
MPQNYLDNLSETQREAVEHRDGPLLVLAGPGSGKTRVVTCRIAELINSGVPPRQILALTFTNKAADEMRSRVEQLVPDGRVWMGTFHRFCARLLRQHAALVGLAENYTIYDTADSKRALKHALETAEITLSHTSLDSIAHQISDAKNSLVGAEDYEPRRGSHIGSIVADAYPAYQKQLLISNAVDFDDLLLHVAVLLRDNPELRASLDERYRYILVDEYQDTNFAQYCIVRALARNYPNLAVTGDPDQSIYGWRGANLNNILSFEHDYDDVRVVRLEQNYRSTQRILRVADTLIENNKRRKAKRLFTDNDEGQRVIYATFTTQRQEAETIAAEIAREVEAGDRRPRDYAIFYRTNALSRALEFALRDQGLPYQMIRGLEFYQRKEVKDCLAYLQLLNNPRDDVALLRVINTPARGIGKTTLEHLADHARRYGISLFDAARESGLIESLSKRAAVAVARFVAMIDGLAAHVHDPIEELLGHLLTESGMRAMYEQSDDEADQERLANIEELLTAARQFDEVHAGENSLEEFLEQSALFNDTDDWQTEQDKVTLMTMHAAKGLEFPVVYVIAVEDGILPHQRSMDEPSQMEEERRLMFVAITRAQERLQLSRARKREFRGQRRSTIPSTFLMELPRDEMEMLETEPEPDPWREERERWDDDDAYDQDMPVESPVVAPSDRSGPSIGVTMGAGIVTAASLGEETNAVADHVPPEDFRHGMKVVHPVHGVGTVVALGGVDAMRSATIKYDSSEVERKVILKHNKLKLVEDA